MTLEDYSVRVRHIAEQLHTLFCRSNHRNDCEWYDYEDDWTEITHQKYLDQAHKVATDFLLRFGLSTLDVTTALEILRARKLIDKPYEDVVG